MPQTMEISNRVSDNGRSSSEISASAAAAQQKALVDAGYAISVLRPRSVERVRQTLLDICKRYDFAKGAIYKRNVGGGNMAEGPSIRFAEAALQAWGNVRISSVITYEDEKIRNVNISVLDLESNACYAEDICLNKTVERKFLRDGQLALGTRMNSNNEKVYIVEATESDMANKTNAMKSKAIRNNGLRLIPQDIVSEGMDEIRNTIQRGDQETSADELKRAIIDAFQGQGVMVEDLEKLLGHSMKGVSKLELQYLRQIYAAINDGEATWSDYAGSKVETKPKAPPAPPPPTTGSKDALGDDTKPPAPANDPAPPAAAAKKRGRPRKEEPPTPSSAAGSTGTEPPPPKKASAADVEKPPLPAENAGVKADPNALDDSGAPWNQEEDPQPEAPKAAEAQDEAPAADPEPDAETPEGDEEPVDGSEQVGDEKENPNRLPPLEEIRAHCVKIDEEQSVEVLRTRAKAAIECLPPEEAKDALKNVNFESMADFNRAGRIPLRNLLRNCLEVAERLWGKKESTSS